MKTRIFILCFVSIFFTRFANATLIDVPATGTVCCIGEIDPQNQFIDYFGQTFVALGNRAESLSFNALNNVSDLYPGAFNFRALLLDTGNANEIANSSILFASNVLTVSDPTEKMFDIDLGGLHLITGHYYAWAIETVTTRDGIQDVGQLAIAGPAEDAYAPGRAFFHVSQEQGLNADLAATWTALAGTFDFAFQMEFSQCTQGRSPEGTSNGRGCSHAHEVPEPGSLPLLLAGLAGVMAARKYKTRLIARELA